MDFFQEASINEMITTLWKSKILGYENVHLYNNAVPHFIVQFYKEEKIFSLVANYRKGKFILKHKIPQQKHVKKILEICN